MPPTLCYPKHVCVSFQLSVKYVSRELLCLTWTYFRTHVCWNISTLYEAISEKATVLHIETVFHQETNKVLWIFIYSMFRKKCKQNHAEQWDSFCRLKLMKTNKFWFLKSIFDLFEYVHALQPSTAVGIANPLDTEHFFHCLVFLGIL